MRGAGVGLELSLRTLKMARLVGAETVWDLAQIPAEKLLETRCVGETQIHEIEASLRNRGLWLGMTRAELRARPGTDGPLGDTTTPPIAASRTAAASDLPESLAGAKEADYEDEPDHCCEHCAEVARQLREQVVAARAD